MSSACGWGGGNVRTIGGEWFPVWVLDVANGVWFRGIENDNFR